MGSRAEPVTVIVSRRFLTSRKACASTVLATMTATANAISPIISSGIGRSPQTGLRATSGC